MTRKSKPLTDIDRIGLLRVYFVSQRLLYRLGFHVFISIEIIRKEIQQFTKHVIAANTALEIMSCSLNESL
jgi:hypothetical protein